LQLRNAPLLAARHESAVQAYISYVIASELTSLLSTNDVM